MKKLMVAIAAAAISFAGFADDTNNWFTAGFGGATSTGGVWVTEGSVTEPSWDEATLMLEDVGADAPVVFKATDSNVVDAVKTVVFKTSVKFQGFDELPAIDTGAKAGVCALTASNYFVVACKEETGKLEWVDTGKEAEFESPVEVEVSVSKAAEGGYAATYTFSYENETESDSFSKEVQIAADSFQEVCYSGNGSVSALAADTILAGVAITPPTIDGLKVTCDKERAAVGAEVTLTFGPDTKIPSIESAVYIVGEDGTLTLKEGEDKVEALAPGAKIVTAIYLTFAEAYTNAAAGATIELCANQDLAIDIEKSITVDLAGKVMTVSKDVKIDGTANTIALKFADSGEIKGSLVLGKTFTVDGMSATLDVSAINVASEGGYLTGFEGAVKLDAEGGSPNSKLAIFDPKIPNIQVIVGEAGYVGAPGERFVINGEVAYATIGDAYVDSFASVQSAIDAGADEIQLFFEYSGVEAVPDTEITFEPSTVVYAATGADDLDGVDLLPTDEVVFDGSCGDYGAWVYSGEPPTPTTVEIQLPAGVEGYSYIVSNMTTGAAIAPASSQAGGATYKLPIDAQVEIYCVAADGYRVTGTNPYVIERVTTETKIVDANLPKAQAAAAKIGTVLYLTLQEAINAAETDDKVTLLKDVSEKITIAADKKLTLDLNKKTLTGTDANYVINNLGTLVITGNGVVDSTAVSHNTLIRNGATGVMTIENGTFKSARITVKNDEDGKGVCGVLTINGGTFLASSEQGPEVWDSVQNWGVATINGGVFDGYIECRAESTWNAGVMTITGGIFQKPVQTVVVFDSTHNAAVNASDVALTIKGGTFNDMVMRVADVKAKAGEAANVRVDFDESMPEYVASCETLGTVTIPGKVDDKLNPAIFANDESVYCEAGYETKDLGDGKYGVEEIVYVAQVGTDKFETLAAAVTAATDGQTITVLDNLELTERVAVEGKDITFDLNAKTVTFTGCSGFYFLGCDGAITNGTVTMDVPATAGSLFAINFEQGNGLVKDVVVNAGNCKYGVTSSCDDCGDDNYNDATVVCKNVDVSGSGMLFYAESQAMTLDADCSATQSGENAAGAVHSDALAAGWLGQLTVNGGTYTAEGNVIATMSSPAKITLNDGTFDGAVTITPVSEGYKEMGEHVITKAEAVELDAPEGFVWSAAVEGMQTLVKPMFMIGETGYASWAEAAAAAKEGDTIKVGANAVIPNPGGVLKGSVPVDLCGQSLTFQGGWLTSGSFTFVDSVGGGQLSMPNGLNCSTTLDLSGLSGEQVVGINKNIKVASSSSLVKFPEGWDLDTCKGCVNSPANGATLVVEGVAYIYDSEKGLWVPEGCYFITITDPENGTLETSATNAVPAGTVVTVTATPDDGYQLVSITTNGEAIVGTEFVMPEGDVTVAATFEAAQSSWDIPGGEGGINALVKEDGTKYVEFTSITFTETGATVGLKAAKIAAQAETFGLVCKTDLTKADTFVINASLSVAEGDPDAKNGLFTISTDLSGYDQLFVVGVGPAAVTE